MRAQKDSRLGQPFTVPAILLIPFHSGWDTYWRKQRASNKVYTGDIDDAILGSCSTVHNLQTVIPSENKLN
jgi:hypothetical protein